MRARRGKVVAWAMCILAGGYAAACASAPNVISPLGAFLTPTASTGAPVPLRADPNARVILSDASSLPAASFLPSQAARGADLYARRCNSCHGAGQLIGETFVQSWNNRRVYDLYTLVRSTMPLSSPGGLKDPEYLDIVAYLLQANKQAMTGSADSLKADSTSMRATRIAISFQ
ncbi:MAG: c-type cytochrome [Gemmatimonadaceae bacterium]